MKTSAISSIAIMGLLLGACAHPHHHASEQRTAYVNSSSGDQVRATRSGSPPPSANEINRETPVSCHGTPIYFADNSDQLDAAAMARLDELMPCMRTGAVHEIVVTGRADRRGNPVDNRALGGRRGVAIATYLRAHGLRDVPIVVRTMGESGMDNNPQLYPYERNAGVVVQ